MTIFVLRLLSHKVSSDSLHVSLPGGSEEDLVLDYNSYLYSVDKNWVNVISLDESPV